MRDILRKLQVACDIIKESHFHAAFEAWKQL
jgi:hypothetical protein